MTPTHLDTLINFWSKGTGVTVDRACKASGYLRRDGVRANGGKVLICDAIVELGEDGTVRLARLGNVELPLVNGEDCSYKSTSA